MLFNSVEYFVFFAVVVALHFILPHRFRWMMLLAASYFFYGCWNAKYSLLLVASTLVAYFAAIICENTTDHRHRKIALTVSIIVNLSILFFFKYWHLFSTTSSKVFSMLGLHWPLGDLNFLLPVGISFFTFQSMSYTFDVYRAKIKAERHLGYLALYKAFFPQMVAGPIERGGHLLPQFRMLKHWDWERMGSGLQLILWGLFKKVVVADRLGLYVDAVYNNAPMHNASSILLATYLFAFQIYCDFSGYSDIAIGSARVLGFELMKNFDTPYFSTSIQEFWRRWHISLSTWLRDYLYITLGGNRKGKTRTYVNLMITMLLGGLWHGASWNFVIWGGFHGVLLCFSRGSRDKGELQESRWAKGLRMFGTFQLVCFAWIFFRSSSWHTTETIFRTLFSRHWGKPFIDVPVLTYGLIGLAILLIGEIYYKYKPDFPLRWAKAPVQLKWATWYFILFMITTAGVENGAQFIYFQF